MFCSQLKNLKSFLKLREAGVVVASLYENKNLQTRECCFSVKLKKGLFGGGGEFFFDQMKDTSMLTVIESYTQQRDTNFFLNQQLYQNL